MTRRTVFWEINRDPALTCIHCQTITDAKFAHELSTYEAYRTVDEIASIYPEAFIITGGDPLARADVFQIVDYARRSGLAPAIELVPTSNLSEDALAALQTSGASGVIFQINGASPYRHDAITGLRGSFAVTTRAMTWANRMGMPLHVMTVLNRRNVAHLSSMSELLRDYDVKSWTVLFEIPNGPERREQMLSADEAETVFGTLASLQRTVPFPIRTMEAPEYKRFLIQNGEGEQWSDFASYIPEDVAGASVDDVVYIAHNGAVRPSAYLPMNGGNLRYRPLRAIVMASDLFATVDDRSSLTGKCGRCEFCHVCGGSRARAWVMTGLLLGPDPLCVHQPARTQSQEAPP